METFYIIILAAHNLLRWVIIALAGYTLFRVYKGWIQKTDWGIKDQKAGTFFTISLDMQLLLGLLLYFVLSPLTKSFFQNIGDAMSNDILRFFGLEHFLLMVIAIALSHYTNSLAKKEMDSQKKFKQTSILFTIVILLILAAIPWSTRPLLPTL